MEAAAAAARRGGENVETREVEDFIVVGLELGFCGTADMTLEGE